MIYKIFERLLASKNNLIKSVETFTKDTNTTLISRDHVNKNPCKKFTQIKEGKSSSIWIEKSQPVSQMYNKIITFQGFRILLGSHCAPKYALYVDAEGKLHFLEKMLHSFSSFAEYLHNKITMDQYKAEIEQIQCENTPLKVKKYTFYLNNYLLYTKNLFNFEYVLAASLLFGKSDLNARSWGKIISNNQEFAAITDHGGTFSKISNVTLYYLMFHFKHRKEKIATQLFADACRELVRNFDQNYQQIIHSCAHGIKACKQAVGFFKQFEVISLAKVIKILRFNRQQLLNIANQIEFELAIQTQDKDRLLEIKEQRAKLSDLLEFGILSSQNKNDGCIELITKLDDYEKQFTNRTSR